MSVRWHGQTFVNAVSSSIPGHGLPGALHVIDEGSEYNLRDTYERCERPLMEYAVRLGPYFYFMRCQVPVIEINFGPDYWRPSSGVVANQSAGIVVDRQDAEL